MNLAALASWTDGVLSERLSAFLTQQRWFGAKAQAIRSITLEDHLRRLGVTAVELMPVHQFIHAKHLIHRDLHNYWGYDSIGFFAPHHEYASVAGEQVASSRPSSEPCTVRDSRSFSTWSITTRRRAITSGRYSPSRGIDNAAYYRLVEGDRRYYMDYTGTGNSLNLRHPHVLQMVTDSLRYWVQEMHADGFRLDLASALARNLHEVNHLGTFFQVIQQDLVSYDQKHNDANGEDSRDGESDNRSWNSGTEGPTDDPGVNALRARQQRNLFATLLLSQGIPMLLASDEIGRTQGGNNNAYCQDNEVSWIDWTRGDHHLCAFVQRPIALRREHPVLRRRRWILGQAVDGEVHDVDWFRPDGHTMTADDWNAGLARALGVFLNGDAIPSRGPRGERLRDSSFLLLLNAHHATVQFTLPSSAWGSRWAMVVDTAALTDVEPTQSVVSQQVIELTGRSLVLLSRVE